MPSETDSSESSFKVQIKMGFYFGFWGCYLCWLKMRTLRNPKLKFAINSSISCYLVKQKRIKMRNLDIAILCSNIKAINFVCCTFSASKREIAKPFVDGGKSQATGTIWENYDLGMKASKKGCG